MVLPNVFVIEVREVMSALVPIPRVVVQFKVGILKDLQLFLSHQHLRLRVDPSLTAIPVHDCDWHFSGQSTVRHQLDKFHLNTCHLSLWDQVLIIWEIFGITVDFDPFNFNRHWLFLFRLLFWLDHDFISRLNTDLEKLFLKILKL